MSDPDDDRHPGFSPRQYGQPGRTYRPLLLLIPIAVALILCIGLFILGLHFLTPPIAPTTGAMKTTAPAQAP
jgi:hypothetical protein